MSDAAGAAGAGAGGEDLKGGAGAGAAGAGAAAGAGGAGAADKGGAGAGAAGAGGGAEGSALSGGDAGSAGEAAAAAPQAWPEDWRERWAGKDDKTLARLKRFATPDNVFKSFLEADAKIRSGQFKRTLAADATDDEIAAFRKENGVPDAPDGYGLGLPEGVEATEADKAILGHFANVFHGMHLPAAAAKGIVEAFHEHTGEVAKALREAARETTINNRATLRAEFGKEYERNRNLGMSFLDDAIGEESRLALVETRLADGTVLGDHPAFVKAVVQTALSQSDDAAMGLAEFGGGGGGSLEDQYKAAMDLKFTDPKKYGSPAHQDKLFKLAGAKAKRAERAA